MNERSNDSNITTPSIDYMKRANKETVHLLVKEREKKKVEKRNICKTLYSTSYLDKGCPVFLASFRFSY